MDVITMEATAYKELIRKIEKIADYVFKKESKPNEEEEIWLDNQEVANLLRISTKTLQRLRKENLISYSMLRGRCRYKLSEIEREPMNNSHGNSHCMYNGFIMNDLYDNGKKNALTYTLMPSLRFEVDFHIICLLSAIYSFL